MVLNINMTFSEENRKMDYAPILKKMWVVYFVFRFLIHNYFVIKIIIFFFTLIKFISCFEF